MEIKDKINQSARILKKEGWGLIPPEQYLIDMEPEFLSLWELVQPYTMTSPERSYALYSSVKYIVENNIPGDFVECGVWKGGSSLLMALTLKSMGVKDRTLWLYDTFSGMPEPGEYDLINWNGKSIQSRWKEGWWSVGLDEVRSIMAISGYDQEKIQYIQGDVIETLKNTQSETFSLIRLDTDWYESTKVELRILYPKLSKKGVLIIDDYGHFRGAKKAVDDYFREINISPLLSRPDYTGRVIIKNL